MTIAPPPSCERVLRIDMKERFSYQHVRAAKGAGPLRFEEAKFSLISAITYPDTLRCYRVRADGSVDTSKEIWVAKPYLLRQTPFDGKTRGGISYTYSTPVKRTASNGAVSQEEIIIPKYVAGDIITARRGMPTLVTNNGEIGGNAVTQKLIWEAYYEGRAWAREVEV